MVVTLNALSNVTLFVSTQLICLRLAEDLPAATLASSSSTLSQLVSTAMISEVDCSSSPGLIAPPHIIHLIDLPFRTEAIFASLAAWFPRLLQFASSSDTVSDINGECRQLIQVCFFCLTYFLSFFKNPEFIHAMLQWYSTTFVSILKNRRNTILIEIVFTSQSLWTVIDLLTLNLSWWKATTCRKWLKFPAYEELN